MALTSRTGVAARRTQAVKIGSPGLTPWACSAHTEDHFIVSPSSRRLGCRASRTASAPPTRSIAATRRAWARADRDGEVAGAACCCGGWGGSRLRGRSGLAFGSGRSLPAGSASTSGSTASTAACSCLRSSLSFAKNVRRCRSAAVSRRRRRGRCCCRPARCCCRSARPAHPELWPHRPAEPAAPPPEAGWGRRQTRRSASTGLSGRLSRRLGGGRRRLGRGGLGSRSLARRAPEASAGVVSAAGAEASAGGGLGGRRLGLCGARRGEPRRAWSRRRGAGGLGGRGLGGGRGSLGGRGLGGGTRRAAPRRAWSRRPETRSLRRAETRPARSRRRAPGSRRGRSRRPETRCVCGGLRLRRRGLVGGRRGLGGRWSRRRGSGDSAGGRLGGGRLGLVGDRRGGASAAVGCGSVGSSSGTGVGSRSSAAGVSVIVSEPSVAALVRRRAHIVGAGNKQPEPHGLASIAAQASANTAPNVRETFDRGRSCAVGLAARFTATLPGSAEDRAMTGSRDGIRPPTGCLADATACAARRRACARHAPVPRPVPRGAERLHGVGRRLPRGNWRSHGSGGGVAGGFLVSAAC